MAAISFFLDKRSTKKDGTNPVKMCVTIARGKQIHLGMDISVRPEEWDAGSEAIIRHPMRVTYNTILKTMRVSAEYFLMNNKGIGKLDTAEIRKSLKACLAGGEPEEEPAPEERPYLFADAYNEFARGIKKASTAGIYKTTYNKLSAYCDMATLRPEDITPAWLRSLEAWLSATSSVNTISVHMRNIRAVMNYAIDEGKTANYPFRKYRIRQEQTEKRSLTPENLARLRDYPCTRIQRPYRDLFMLIFYLIGINTIDLFHLRPESLRDGRIHYRREKTGRLYSIRLEPEAEEIINRYRGNAYLIDVLDTYKNYVDFRHRMNENLRKIGEFERKGRGGKKTVHPAFPGLTTYWARHTWATIAASLDIPKETIAAALGHELGNKTTSIYIDFDQRKVDEANRKVIDFLNEIKPYNG